MRAKGTLLILLIAFGLFAAGSAAAAAPSITIVSPSSGWYNTTVLLLNVTTDNPANVTFNTSAYSTEVTLFNDATQGNITLNSTYLSEGNNTIYIWAMNSTNASETNSSSVANVAVDTAIPGVTNFQVSPNVSISLYNPMTISANVSDTNLAYVDILIVDTNDLIGSNQTLFLSQRNDSGENTTYTLLNWQALYLNISNGTISELISAGLDTTPPTEVFIFGYFQKNATEPAQPDCALIFNASGEPPLILLAVSNKTGGDLTNQIENGTSNFTVTTDRFFGGSGPPTEVNGSTFILYNISTSNELNPYLNSSLVASGNYSVFLRAVDDANNENAETANITVDNDPASINITSPANTTYYNDTSLEINFTTNEPLNSCWYQLDQNGTNITIPGCSNGTAVTVQGNWIHNLTLWAQDLANNIGSDIEFFTISCTESWNYSGWGTCSCSTSTQSRSATDANNCGTIENRSALTQSCTPTGCGGGGGGSTTTSDLGVLTEEGKSKLMSLNEKVKFTIANASHTATLTAKTSTNVTLEITSDPVTVVLNVNETKKLDLDADDIYELAITLNSLNNTSANLTFAAIEEAVEEEVEEISQCVESWSCTEWSECTDSTQTRNCTDANKCGTVAQKPSETQSCAPSITGGVIGAIGLSTLGLWTLIAFIIIAVVVYSLTPKKKK